MEITKPKLPKIKKIWSPQSWTIISNLFRKELFTYFVSPFIYIVFILFIVIVGLILFGFFNFTLIGTSDLTLLFTSIAISFVIIIPALTMGTFSKEKQQGTYELILTQPLNEFHLLISKFFSVAAILFLMLLLTLPFSVLVSQKGGVDTGRVIMQYVGVFVLGLSFTSVGLFVSSIFKNEMTSLISGIIFSAILILLGSDFLSFLPLALNSILEKISLLYHFEWLSRGVLDTRDALFFIAFILTFLSLTYLLLVKDKYPLRHPGFRKYILYSVLFLVFSLGVGLIGDYIPGRIDFTENKIYTLSDETKNIIDDYEGEVNLTLYVSSNLPVQFQSNLRAVEDLLKEYDSTNGGNIIYTKKNPDNNEDAKTEAENAGVQPIVFAVNSEDSSQQTVGYFGVRLEYEGEVESIPFLQNIDQLEFEVTKAIKKLTDPDKKTIAFLSEKVAHTLTYDYRRFGQVLRELYEVKNILLDDSLEDIDLLVLPGPNAEFTDEEIQKLHDFYNSGGNVLFLADPVTVSLQTLQAEISEDNLQDFFSDEGIQINTNLAYDLQNNNIVNAGGAIPVPVRYPLWISARTTESSAQILRDIDQVSILWGSSLDLEDGAENVTQLLITSDASNVQQEGSYNAEIQQNFSYQQDDSIRTLAAAVENSNGGRTIVVGDSGLFSDNLEQIVTDQNLAFGLSSIEWLTDEVSLSSIQAKSRIAQDLNLTSDESRELIIMSISIPVVLTLFLGTGRFLLRYQRVKKNR